MAGRAVVIDAAKRDAVIAKRGAIAVMVIAACECALLLFFLTTNLILAISKNVAVEDARPRASLAEQWTGRSIFVPPVWMYLILLLALVVLLVVTRNPSRQYKARMHGKILLQNNPAVIGIFGLLLGLFSGIAGANFAAEPLGLYWIPVVISCAFGISSTFLGMRQGNFMWIVASPYGGKRMGLPPRAERKSRRRNAS